MGFARARVKPRSSGHVAWGPPKEKTRWTGAPSYFASMPQQSLVHLEKPLDMGLMLYLNVASLTVGLSQHFGASRVPDPNLEPLINPLLKHTVKDPWKAHKYMVQFMFSHQGQQ